MTKDDQPPIEHSIWIDADLTMVFAYLIDERKLVTWMGAVARLDPTPGGEYRVLFKEGRVSRGRFVEISPPHRVVYTVGWEGSAEFPPGITLVEIELEGERAGTRLNLKHFGPPARGLEADVWLAYLDRLTGVATGSRMPDDPV